MKVIQRELKATKKELKTKEVMVLFEKNLTSESGANVIGIGVHLQKSLGNNIRTLNSHIAGDIMGLVGDPSVIEKVLENHKVTYARS